MAGEEHRQTGDRGLLEERAHRQLDPQPVAQPGDHLGGEQRVPAQGEEVVVHPHPLAAEQVAPDPRQHLLRRRTRCLVRRPTSAVSPGAGSALRSTFPVRVSGSAASSTHIDGTMNEGRREPR